MLLIFLVLKNIENIGKSEKVLIGILSGFYFDDPYKYGWM